MKYEKVAIRSTMTMQTAARYQNRIGPCVNQAAMRLAIVSKVSGTVVT
jgi:hypothetical protein